MAYNNTFAEQSSPGHGHVAFNILQKLQKRVHRRNSKDSGGISDVVGLVVMAYLCIDWDCVKMIWLVVTGHPAPNVRFSVISSERAIP